MDSPISADASGPVSLPPAGVLGTRLRFLLDQLEAGVAAAYADLGLPGFRTRYNPLVRVLTQAGPRSIRDLAAAVGVTHSAVSQTVAQMAKDGLVALAPGRDARQRIVSLTPKAESLLPLLEAEWRATTAAAGELDTELPFPLSRLVEAALEALESRSMRERISARLERPQA